MTTYVALTNVWGSWEPVAAGRTKQQAHTLAAECISGHPGHMHRGIALSNIIVLPRGKARAALKRTAAAFADLLDPGQCACALPGFDEVASLAYTY
jgi:hypothetical protein